MLTKRLLVMMLLVVACFTIGSATFQGHLTPSNFHYIPGPIKTLGWPPFMMVNNHTSCVSEGLFQHPDDCAMFYRCTRNVLRNEYNHLTFKCENGTIFSPEQAACVIGTCSQDSSSSSAIEIQYHMDDLILMQGTPSRSSSNNLWKPKYLLEGRYPDEEDCGKFHDCILNKNGELLCTTNTCFGGAYDETTQTCIPSHMIEGCYPGHNRSPRQLEDPTLQGLCSNNSFKCLDCQNLIICLENTSYPIPCKDETACVADIEEFKGGVCHPKVPTDCSCNQDDLLKKDLYDPSKYLECSAASRTPEVKSCPEESLFNESRKDCGASLDPTCSSSGPGTFAVQNDCSRYYECIFTSRGWIQNWFSCPNEKMYNTNTGACEDPCQWQYGNFSCQDKGRFPNPINCSGYYECIEDLSNLTKFILVEKFCPPGYEWTQEVNEGHCLEIGTIRTKCVERKIKPKGCSYPTELCRSKALTDCANEHSNCECEENPDMYPINCYPCPVGYVSNTTGCFPLCSNLTCSDTEMCLDGDGTKPGVCTCISGFIREGNQCKGTCRNTTCGVETCTENGITYNFCECKDNNGTTAGKCLPCPEGHVSNTTGCYPDCSTLTCKDNEICSDNSGTLPGECKCVSGHVREGNQCKGTCKHTTCGVQSCFDNGVEHSFCECKDNNSTTAGKCVPCAEGHVSNTTGCYSTCSNLNCGANEECFDGNGKLPGVCECLPGYTRKGEKCIDRCDSVGGVKLDDQCLIFNVEELNWLDAVTACSTMGHQLASLTDIQSVRYHMKTIDNRYSHWVGGTDILSEGNWEWLDGRPWSTSGGSDTRDNFDCYYVNNVAHDNLPCNRALPYICSTMDDAQQRSAASYIAKEEGLLKSRIVETQCPGDSFQVGEECFFIPDESFMTWADAQLVCNEEGGFLAEPESITEFYEALSSRSKGYNYWVGGNYNSDDQNWRWSSTKSLIPPSPYWNTNFGGTVGSDTSCLLLMKGENLSLYRGKCQDYHLFVCEKRQLKIYK